MGRFPFGKKTKPLPFVSGARERTGTNILKNVFFNDNFSMNFKNKVIFLCFL